MYQFLETIVDLSPLSFVIKILEACKEIWWNVCVGKKSRCKMLGRKLEQYEPERATLECSVFVVRVLIGGVLRETQKLPC